MRGTKNTDWLSLLKAFLLRGGLLSLGLGLITAGGNIISSGYLWEVLFEFTLKIIKPDQSSDSYAIYQFSLSALLIATGFITIYLWITNERKLKYFQITFDSYHLLYQNYYPNILFDDWLDGINPKFEFQIPLRFNVGLSSVSIKKISIVRFINNEQCWCKNAILKKITSTTDAFSLNQSQNDYETFDGVHLEPFSSTKFIYQREARGPRGDIYGHELSYGKGWYEVKCVYRYRHKITDDIFICRKQEDSNNSLFDMQK